MKTYPVGAATYSKHPDRISKRAPRFADWARGAYVMAGGREYVDLTSGMGAVILGHDHLGVRDAILRQLNRGIAFPIPTELEHEVPELLLSLLTWERAESVRFGKNGADVTTTAVRLARAVTGKRRILYLDYHGHHDWSMTQPPWNGGVANADSVRVDTGRESGFRPRDLDVIRTFVGFDPDVAAIVLEPVPSNTGEVSSPEFWSGLRALCDEIGCLLILDEMVSGFRAAPGGGAELFGIEPDLACYGKAMANGMPLSAIVGPYEYLKRYEEDVFFSITHGGEALSLAAARATMGALKDGFALKQIGNLGHDILGMFHVKHATDRVRHGYPQRLLFDFTEAERETVLDHGVLCAGYANLTLSHALDEGARAKIATALEAALGG